MQYMLDEHFWVGLPPAETLSWDFTALAWKRLAKIDQQQLACELGPFPTQMLQALVVLEV